MGFISFLTRLAGSALLAAACEKTLYLTIDTGSMGPAEEIAAVLRKHKVKATFFVANEKTTRGDMSMDTSWSPFWKALVADGHAFGSHTFRHWYFRKDLPGGKVAYIGKEGKREELDRAGVCRELKQSEEVFQKLTGRGYDAIWRAPGDARHPSHSRARRPVGTRNISAGRPPGSWGTNSRRTAIRTRHFFATRSET